MATPTSQTRASRRRPPISLPNARYFIPPLDRKERTRLLQMNALVRARPIESLDREANFLRRLQNRHLGVLTIGEVVDADLCGELMKWPGAGRAVVQWIRDALLRLA